MFLPAVLGKCSLCLLNYILDGSYFSLDMSYLALVSLSVSCSLRQIKKTFMILAQS